MVQLQNDIFAYCSLLYSYVQFLTMMIEYSRFGAFCALYMFPLLHSKFKDNQNYYPNSECLFWFLLLLFFLLYLPSSRLLTVNYITSKHQPFSVQPLSWLGPSPLVRIQLIFFGHVAQPPRFQPAQRSAAGSEFRSGGSGLYGLNP